MDVCTRAASIRWTRNGMMAVISAVPVQTPLVCIPALPSKASWTYLMTCNARGEGCYGDCNPSLNMEIRDLKKQYGTMQKQLKKREKNIVRLRTNLFIPLFLMCTFIKWISMEFFFLIFTSTSPPPFFFFLNPLWNFS